MLEHLDFVIERDVQAPAQPLRREQSMRRLARIQAAQPRHPPFERVREGDSDEVPCCAVSNPCRADITGARAIGYDRADLRERFRPKFLLAFESRGLEFALRTVIADLSVSTGAWVLLLKELARKSVGGIGPIVGFAHR